MNSFNILAVFHPTRGKKRRVEESMSKAIICSDHCFAVKKLGCISVSYLTSIFDCLKINFRHADIAKNLLKPASYDDWRQICQCGFVVESSGGSIYSSGLNSAGHWSCLQPLNSAEGLYSQPLTSQNRALRFFQKR